MKLDGDFLSILHVITVHVVAVGSRQDFNDSGI